MLCVFYALNKITKNNNKLYNLVILPDWYWVSYENKLMTRNVLRISNLFSKSKTKKKKKPNVISVLLVPLGLFDIYSLVAVFKQDILYFNKRWNCQLLGHVLMRNLVTKYLNLVILFVSFSFSTTRLLTLFSALL